MRFPKLLCSSHIAPSGRRYHTGQKKRPEERIAPARSIRDCGNGMLMPRSPMAMLGEMANRVSSNAGDDERPDPVPDIDAAFGQQQRDGECDGGEHAEAA